MNNFLNYLKKFNKKDAQKNFCNEESKDYEYYDEISARDYSERLVGMHEKKFVRFSSDFFGDLIENIRDSENPCYQTYMNDIIKEGYTPKYLSVLMKYNDKNTKYIIYNEYLASKICNCMGVPTSYNQLYKKDDKLYLLSVDFLKPDERILDINDLIFEIKGDNMNFNIYDDTYDYLSSQIFELSQVIRMNKIRGGGRYAWNFDEGKYYRDYVNMFLTRCFLLGDMDFFAGNVVNILDNENNMHLGPAFDCEFTFGKSEIDEKDKVNLIYAKNKYPTTYEKFCSNLDKMMKKDTFNALFTGIEDKEYVKNRKKEMQSLYSSFLNFQSDLETKIEL